LELLDCFPTYDDRIISCYWKKKFFKEDSRINNFSDISFSSYITFGKIKGGTPPILNNTIDTVYSNPLPHVLILTAILLFRIGGVPPLILPKVI
jgi:hypothetical protein